MMRIPLTARGVIMGVIVLYRLDGSKPFTPRTCHWHVTWCPAHRCLLTTPGCIRASEPPRSPSSALTVVLTLHSTPHTANASSGAYKAGRIAGGAISGLIAGGLWLCMAWANKRGRSWARIVSTVLFGLLSLEAAASLPGTLPAALKIVTLSSGRLGSPPLCSSGSANPASTRP
jgi:hypothetical protein